MIYILLNFDPTEWTRSILICYDRQTDNGYSIIHNAKWIRLTVPCYRIPLWDDGIFFIIKSKRHSRKRFHISPQIYILTNIEIVSLIAIKLNNFPPSSSIHSYNIIIYVHAPKTSMLCVIITKLFFFLSTKGIALICMVQKILLQWWLSVSTPT